LPLDLAAVFAAGSILILTSIAYPYVAIDESCIAKADEMLAWMHSKGNVPANCRRTELAELQAAANRINISCSQSSLDSRTPIHISNWMWDTLDFDGGALNLDLASSYLNLTSDDALMVGIAEEM
jgi:hypothetical protein